MTEEVGRQAALVRDSEVQLTEERFKLGEEQKRFQEKLLELKTQV